MSSHCGKNWQVSTCSSSPWKRYVEDLSGFGSFGATVPGKVSDFRKSFVFLYFPPSFSTSCSKPFLSRFLSRCMCVPHYTIISNFLSQLSKSWSTTENYQSARAMTEQKWRGFLFNSMSHRYFGTNDLGMFIKMHLPPCNPHQRISAQNKSGQTIN